MRATRLRSRLALGLALGLGLQGCAVLGEEHRVLARALDERAAPESRAARVMFAPLALPLGAFALGVDAALINPVRALPRAFEDAREVVDVGSTGPLEVFVFPMRCVTFVAVLFGSELVRIWVPL